MESEVLLKSACELSYGIAREGAESDPPIEPPQAMRSFLYVGDLPERALTVAQQAIEDDPAFRRRVAERVSEDDVGRAGYLWLHRPIGWAAEFEDLSAAPDDGFAGVLQTVPAMNEDLTAENEFAADGFGVDAPVGDGIATDTAMPEDLFGDEPTGALIHGDGDGDGDDEEGGSLGVAPALGFGSIEALGDGEGALELSMDSDSGGRSEANAIEDELSSLRGLVDRLSSERKVVSTSVRRVEQELETSKVQPSVFDSDVYTLQSELDAARIELDAARAERDTAVRQHSDSLTRQLDLERELERARELRAELELEHADADSETVIIRESLARAEATLQNLQVEREDLSSRVSILTSENETLNNQVALLDEEKSSVSKAMEADYNALRAETDSLRTDKDGLAAKLSVVETDLNEARAQLSQTGIQATEAKSLVDALTEEKIDLASRLADTEAMLETTRAQLGAVKSDAEAVTADLSNIKAHRDGLAVQVDELHGSLSEALNDLAKVRSTSDADRASLKEVRSERDLLRVRVGSLEQIETGLEAKLANLTIERDALNARTESAKADLAENERTVRTLTGDNERLAEELRSGEEIRTSLLDERDAMSVEIDDLKARLADVEVTRDGFNQQVDQLTEENSALQMQLVEAERVGAEASANQGLAVSELAQRLSLVENERARLEGDLREAEARLSESVALLETATAQAEALAQQNRANALAGSGDTDTGIDIDTDIDDDADVVASGVPEAVEEIADVADALPGSAEPAVLDSALIPPPAPLDDAVSIPGPPMTEPAVEADDAEQPPEDRGRSTKRHWFGSVLRGDSGESEKSDNTADEVIPPPTVGDEETTSVFPASPVADAGEIDELDDVGAALAATLGRDPATTPDSGPAADQAGMPGDVSDAEIDSISSELSEVAGIGKVDTDDADEDLDEISNLISQTITDFDPKSLERPNFGEDPAATTAQEDEPRRRRSRRLFAKGSDDTASDSGPLTSPNGLAAGATPPSVFDDNDSSSIDDDAAKSEPEARSRDLSGFDDVGPNLGDTSTSGAATGSGRRQIDIPSDIADDEVEVARHIVSSADIVLLVDGDSVAKMGWPSLPVAQQRDALVSYLADLSATTGAAPDVVFDGRIGEEESLPASRAVRIRLSTPPTEPVAALDELVDAYPEQWPIAIVTDDSALSASAAERGAVVLNNGQLLDLFIAP